MPVPAGLGSSTPEGGPCDWPAVFCGTAEEGEPTPCSHLNTLSEPMREIIIAAATEDLWNWTGRRFGLCEVAVRPCSEDCTRRSTWQGWSGNPPGFYGQMWFPYIYQGQWYNSSPCGTCNRDRCGCSKLSTIVLPGPAYEIIEVRIDGAVLDPSAYRLDNLGLSRIDGVAWPECQDMSADPETDPDTLLVTYLRGEPVPSGGQLALGALACELAKLNCGDPKCRLPKRATTVAREGVTITMPVSMEFENGQTGLWEVDRWLASIQHANRSSYRITSPDVRPLRRKW